MNRFEILLVEEIPRLRRYARGLCGDIHQADDLVQECLARAISRRRLWIGHKGMRPWLFTILHNIFINTLRHAGDTQLFSSTDEYSESAVTVDDAETLCSLSDF